jgi:hypothetical protein
VSAETERGNREKKIRGHTKTNISEIVCDDGLVKPGTVSNTDTDLLLAMSEYWVLLTDG